MMESIMTSTTENAKQIFTQYRERQQQQEAQAIEVLQLLSQLRLKDVQISFFGKSLGDKSIQKIIAYHHNLQLDLETTVAVLRQLTMRDVHTLNIDIAQLVVSGQDIGKMITDLQTNDNKPSDVVLYGFGRIGRMVTRLLMSRPASEHGLQLKGIVVRPTGAGDLAKRASLLKHDSVHGKFIGSVRVDEENCGIIVNGRFIRFIYAQNPAEIDYTEYGIDDALVIDNTGIWTDEESLGQHLQSKGVSKVLLTAPAKGDIKNIVYNVNSDTIGDDKIVSAASCTTNAITPALSLLHDQYGVLTGHVETIHSYTNDQNLIDNFHKKDRRGRGAVQNMVITSTGAAKAVGKALPELAGKLTGNAIRVPTPNVSMAILNLTLDKAPASVDELNNYLKQKADTAEWQNQIGYSDSSEAVSTDFIGEQKVGIIDAKATILTENHATIYIWYDNEVGYSTQVIRVAEKMMHIEYAQLNYDI